MAATEHTVNLLTSTLKQKEYHTPKQSPLAQLSRRKHYCGWDCEPLVIWWTVGQVSGWWSTRRRAGQKRLVEMSFEAYPTAAPWQVVPGLKTLKWRRKRCFRPGNDISKGPEVRLYVDWLGWLIYSKSICWDLVMCWAQHRPTGHGPCCHGLYGPVGWGGREKDETASRSLNVNCGRIFDTALGKRKKPENKQFPSCHYYCYCQNAYLSGFWLFQAVPSGSRPSWEQWVFPDWGF